MRRLFLDTETTGLYRNDRIIEIGIVEVLNGNTVDVLHQYINPQVPIPSSATRIHGVSDEMVKDKPTFNEVADSLIEQVRDSEIVIHNAAFDTYYINYELALMAQRERDRGDYVSLQDLCSKVIDSLAIARAKFPGQSNSLDALLARFNIAAEDRANHHGALLDARLLAKVYQAMCFTQSSLNLESVTIKARLKDLNVDISSLGPFKVVEPTEAEQKAHEALLKELDIKEIF